MASQTQPPMSQFFVTREDGTMVPMIAMDDLPDHVIIEDVPRTLTPTAIAGMTCVGVVKGRTQKHTVSITNRTQPAQVRAKGSITPPYHSDDDDIRNITTPQHVGVAASALLVERINAGQAREPVAASTIQEVKMDLPASPESQKGSANSSGTFVPRVKEYCSYWLRRGECDYAQQGCMFRHEMPQDEEALRRLGLRDIPQWYRGKYGVGSILAVEGAGASKFPTHHEPPARFEPASDSKRNQTRNRFAQGRQNQPSKKQALRASGSKQQASGRLINNKESSSLPSNRRFATLKPTSNNSSSSRNLGVIVAGNSNVARRDSVAESVYSDIEMEYIREDRERKAREDAEYAIQIEQERQRKEKEKAEAEADKALEEKAGKPKATRLLDRRTFFGLDPLPAVSVSPVSASVPTTVVASIPAVATTLPAVAAITEAPDTSKDIVIAPKAEDTAPAATAVAAADVVAATTGTTEKNPERHRRTRRGKKTKAKAQQTPSVSGKETQDTGAEDS